MKNLIFALATMFAITACALDGSESDARIDAELRSSGIDPVAARKAVAVPDALDVSKHGMRVDTVNGGAKDNTTCLYISDCYAFSPNDDTERDRLCVYGCAGPAFCNLTVHAAPGINCLDEATPDFLCHWTGRCERSSGRQ